MKENWNCDGSTKKKQLPRRMGQCHVCSPLAYLQWIARDKYFIQLQWSFYIANSKKSNGILPNHHNSFHNWFLLCYSVGHVFMYLYPPCDIWDKTVDCPLYPSHNIYGRGILIMKEPYNNWHINVEVQRNNAVIFNAKHKSWVSSFNFHLLYWCFSMKFLLVVL